MNILQKNKFSRIYINQFLHQVYRKLLENFKTFYDLLHENAPWDWTEEHERLFQISKSLTS